METYPSRVSEPDRRRREADEEARERRGGTRGAVIKRDPSPFDVARGTAVPAVRPRVASLPRGTAQRWRTQSAERPPGGFH
ncbi:hypothetical protein SKAU_G00338050 [Synaphobranchus kaupii]|uniref:Uncharacterized protein n=1 Tax=Synaphobranchus kaupii TaxID=118154 RepID=A0A9Q1EMI3_SYNKA|nr:hypothetical protein SKAU_G00338050 [Synaphobranchus kaupii]